VGGIERAVDHLGLAAPVDRPDVLHVQDGQEKPLRVPQAYGLAGLEGACLDFRDVEADRDRPQPAVLQPHAVEHRLVVGAGHESLQG